ncbi:hypothetical protein J6590_015635 [Homalodisca vitripennis]|nr:hypothetical protein J6590_015635 [Homalodisca vitripennis]
MANIAVSTETGFVITSVNHMQLMVRESLKVHSWGHEKRGGQGRAHEKIAGETDLYRKCGHTHSGE